MLQVITTQKKRKSRTSNNKMICSTNSHLISIHDFPFVIINGKLGWYAKWGFGLSGCSYNGEFGKPCQSRWELAQQNCFTHQSRHWPVWTSWKWWLQWGSTAKVYIYHYWLLMLADNFLLVFFFSLVDLTKSWINIF